MSTRHKLWTLWGLIGLLLALVLAPMWRPLRVAWHCYWLHENGVREQARVLAKLDEQVSFALLVEEGPHAGQACTASTAPAIFEATREGDRLEVVYAEWKPGSCELSTTIEASAWLLFAVLAGVAGVGVGLLAFGLLLQRSFTRPVQPERRLRADARDVRCPACGKQMDEGYVPLLAALSWRRPGEPIGLPHALRGLPGTIGWRSRPRLHAFRCVPCEVLTLQYGEAERS